MTWLNIGMCCVCFAFGYWLGRPRFYGAKREQQQERGRQSW